MNHYYYTIPLFHILFPLLKTNRNEGFHIQYWKSFCEKNWKLIFLQMFTF